LDYQTGKCSVVAIAAAIVAVSFHSLLQRLSRAVLIFDALGLSLLAVSGAKKGLEFGYNKEVALLLGMITAIGGGVLRDISLNRILVILEKESYASAAQ
jgi:uncharacterized membrane protein YeiH